jgi:hypothetical protein
MFLQKFKNCVPKSLFNFSCEKKCKVEMKIRGKFNNCKFKAKIYFTLNRKDKKHYSLKKLSIKNLIIYDINSSCEEHNYLLDESTCSSNLSNSSSYNSSEKEHLLYNILKNMILTININYNKEKKKHDIMLTKPSKIEKMKIKGKYVCV